MSEKRRRGQNFSLEDKDRLIQLLLKHKDTVLNKKTDGATNEAKSLAWVAITDAFNASSNTYRTKESLMKVWDKLKSESKLYHVRMSTNATQTGGGPSVVKFDPVLEQVCSILGRGCTGILVVSDSDADTGIELEQSLPKVVCIPNGLWQSGKEEGIIGEAAKEPEITQEWRNQENLTPRLRQPEITQCDDDGVEISSVDGVQIEAIQELQKPAKTPLWSRRRPQISRQNERSEATALVSSNISHLYKRKEGVEELKEQLLQQELDFKKRLYELQLQAAVKDVEIKTAMLDQIKGTGFSINLYGVQHNKDAS